MKFFSKLKNYFPDVAAYLFILLFVYAAVSKLLEYENFAVQIGQSPLLSAYAGLLAWLVPALEIIIAFLLIFKRLQFWSLFAAYVLMIMFTAYIFIMLNYSSFLPCSCGGILEKLDWTEHLIFNIGFVVLAFIAMILILSQDNQQKVASKTLKSLS